MAVINGTTGDDTLTGTPLDDTITTLSGTDTVNADAGDDTIIVDENGLGTIDGGAGNDTVQMTSPNLFGFSFLDTGTGNIIINSAIGNYTLTNVERVETYDGSGNLIYLLLAGGGSNDVLDASAEPPSFQLTLHGLGGNDMLTSGSAFADLYGGDGNDILTSGSGGGQFDGGAGADTLNAGIGFDSLNYQLSSAAVNIDLTGNTANTGGDAAGDVFSGNFEAVYGSNFGDTIIGSNNTSFQEAIFGGEGNDTISGGNGNDQIYGEAGSDILTGGAGDDTFYYFNYDNANELNDTITDFAIGDRLQMQEGSINGNFVLPTFIGMAAFSGVVGELRYEKTGGQTLIYLDSNGDGTANQTLTLSNGEFDLLEVNSDVFSFNLIVDTSVNGTPGADTLNGTPGDDIINGLGGNDTITTLTGNDLIDGGDGNDIIIGDNLGSGTIEGGTGTDLFQVSFNGGGFGTFFSEGQQSLQVFTSGGFYDVTNVERYEALDTGGTATQVTLVGDSTSETLDGSAETVGSLVIYGAGGNDTITGTGASGFDQLYGGAGNDIIYGLAGADILYGQDGDDQLFGGADNDALYDNRGINVLDGGAGFDDANLYNLSFNPGQGLSLSAAAGDTLAEATSSSSWQFNAVENIRLEGTYDDDVIDFSGFNQADVNTIFVTSSQGQDTVTVNGSTNTDFVYDIEGYTTGYMDGDTISGFSLNDTLLLRNFDALDTVDLNFIGTAAFTNSGGEVRYTKNATDTVVEIDRDGDGVADETLTLTEAMDLQVNQSGSFGSGAGYLRIGQTPPPIVGTPGDDILNGTPGNDVIDGLAGDDVITGDAGADTLTGGAGADIFQTTGDSLSNSEAELYGDTITDFGLEDLITFNAGVNLVDGYDFTNNGDGSGFLSLSNGEVLNFTGLSATDDLVVISDRVGLEEVRMLDAGVLNITLDRNYLDFYADVERVNLTIDDGIIVGETPLFPGVFGRIDLDLGVDYNISNDGLIRGLSLQSDASVVTNTGAIEANFTALGFSETNASASSTVTVVNQNGASIAGANGIAFNASPAFTPADSGIDVANISNDGLIQGYFTAIRAGANDSLIIDNSGTIQTLLNPAGTVSSSQGLSTNSDSTQIVNSGVIEVLSSEGGYFQQIDGFAILGGSFEGSDFTLTNSGRISSTGAALLIGGQFNETSPGDPLPQFVTTIVNTSTGIIESDTNSDSTVSEYAIAGASGGFVLDNTANATIETLNRFVIDNDGQITGDISLYTVDYFTISPGIGFLFDSSINQSVAQFGVPDGPNVEQDRDVNNLPVNDVNGDPVFTPGTVISASLGTLSYSVDGATRIVTLLDGNGDSIILRPDAENIVDGAFDDNIDNTGMIDGDIETGLGNDVIINRGNINGDIYLGEGNDNYTAGAAGLSGDIYGGAGNDIINARGGDQTIYGEDGNDFLRGGEGNDTLEGGFGVDWLRGGEGADVLNGFAGQDWADYLTSSTAVTVNLQTGTGFGGDAQGDSFNLIERVYGSNHDDNITGDGNVNYLRGAGGDDTLSGGGGVDYLQGDAGADALDGGAGSDFAYYVSSSIGLTIDLGNTANNTGEAIGDTYTSIENVFGSRFDDVITGDSGGNFLRGFLGDDTLNGGAGDDLLRGDQGADIIDGGAGNDWLYYATSNAAVTIDLAAGTASGGHATGDIFISIERVFGSVFGDTITGEGGHNYLRGFSGNDTLMGGGGIDFLQGDAGADVLDGGAGTDWAFYVSAKTDLTIDLSNSANNTGEASGDTYISIESVVGGRFNDTITGDSGNNYLRGFLGDDIINGGAGNDTLRGEAGKDTFVFETGTGSDTVIDYNDAEDMLDFSEFGFTDVNDALSNAVDTVGGDVVFTIGGDVITIEDTTILEITDNMIV